MSSIKYQLLQTEQELSNLKRDFQELYSNHIKLDKEHYDMKLLYGVSTKNEKTLKVRADQAGTLDNELKSLREEIVSKESIFKRKEREMLNKFEKEAIKNRNLNENIQSKIEMASGIHRLSDRQQEEILKLEKEILEKEKQFSSLVSQLELKHEINLSDLKKKMVDYIKETHKNTTKLNVEQLDTSSKLTLLQNHQLLIELEYNSRQIEELLKKIEKLEKNNFDLRRELEINKEVQLSLAEKNKNISEIFAKILKKEKNSRKDLNGYDQPSLMNMNPNTFTVPILASNTIHNTNKNFLHQPISLPQPLQNSETSSFNLKKIQSLEKLLKKKENDYNKMKMDYDSILQKLSRYENKSAIIFDLIETGFKKLANDEGLKNLKEVFVNVDNLNLEDFENLSSEEKYSILMILLKHLLPLLSFEGLDRLEFTKNVVNSVKMRYGNNMLKEKNNQFMMIKTFSGSVRNSKNMNKLFGFKNIGMESEKGKEKEIEKRLKTSPNFKQYNPHHKEIPNLNKKEFFEVNKERDNKYNGNNYRINLLSI